MATTLANSNGDVKGIVVAIAALAMASVVGVGTAILYSNR